MIELSYIDLYLITGAVIFISLVIYTILYMRSYEGHSQPIIKFDYNEKHLTPLHEMIVRKTKFVTSQKLVQIFNNDVEKVGLSKKITEEIVHTLSAKYLTIIYGYISKQSLKLYIQQQVLTEMDAILIKSNIYSDRDNGLDVAISSHKIIKEKPKNRQTKHKGLK